METLGAVPINTAYLFDSGNRSVEINCTDLVSMYHINTQSLSNEIDQIASFLDEFEFDVLCLTKHWQNESNLTTSNIPGYSHVNHFCGKSHKFYYLWKIKNYIVSFNVKMHSELFSIVIKELKTYVFTPYRSQILRDF